MNHREFKVIVASTNPVKVNAAVSGLQRMFPSHQFQAEPVAVPSGVADQPMSDAETLAGALNRVNNAFEAYPEADYWIGIEGGVDTLGEDLAAFAWIVVRNRNMIGKARSGIFFLPQTVKELVEQGIELGIADDMVFNHSNSKQKGGAIGILTDNALDRKQLYEQAVMLALVPFKNEALYTSSKTKV